MPTNVQLQTREQRKKLPIRADHVYYRDIAKGIAIGYRKNQSGGVFSLRTFNGRKYHKRSIGAADDTADADGVTVFAWKDVVKIALAEPAKADAFTAKYSVSQCLEDYFRHRRSSGRSAESLAIDQGKAKPFIEKFGADQVSALRTDALQRWLDSLVAVPGADSGLSDAQRREAMRASQNSANRVWTPCLAALNYAFSQGRVDSDLEWRRISKFQDVDQARKRFLSVPECNRLLGACSGAFRDLVQAALLSGLRPGELVRLEAGQFQQTRLEVSAGKTGRSRYVPLTTQGVTLFKKLARGRAAADLLLPNPAGVAWTRMQIARAMREAVAAAKLETPAVFYDLRRSYGSLLANAQANDATIAHALGHSDTRMTRRHYAHLLDSVVAAELQAKLPTFKARVARKVPA